VEQIIIRNYTEYLLSSIISEGNITDWNIEYAIQSETIEDAEILTSNFYSMPDIIALVLSLELEAELSNRSVVLEIPDQNVTTIAWTDPPTIMPTHGPSKFPTLSPTRDGEAPPTKEPTNFPSRDPTRRPTFGPSQPPTPVPTSIPDIKPIHAEFNSNGLSINVFFDISTNQPGSPNFFDCANLIDSPTVRLLGTTFEEGGARCEWGSKSLLVIYTGFQPTIVPGQNITFLNSTLCYGMICTEYDTHPMPSRTLPIAPNSDPVEVTISLMGPAAIGLCQDAKIQLTAAGGAGRALSIEWDIPDELLYSNSCNLTTDLDFLFLDAHCTEDALDNGYFTVGVTVSSWLESYDTAYFDTYFQADYIPDISLRGAKSIAADPLSGTEIAINVALPDCVSSGGYTFVFFWRQTLGIRNAPQDFGWGGISSWDVNTDTLSLGNAVTRKNLVISEGSMQYDTYYTFHLRVTGAGFENDFNYVGIKTDLRPMAEAVPFAEEKAISTDEAVDISALEWFLWADIREVNDWWQHDTLDADNEIEAIEYLYEITWNCSEITGSSVLSNCDPDPLEIQDEGTLTLSFTRDEALHYINTVGKRYRFTVTLVDQYDRTVDNYVEYKITTRKFPSVTISPANIVISAGQMSQMTAFVVSSGTLTPNGLIADSLTADEILNRYKLEWNTTKESLPLSEETGALTGFSTSIAFDSTAEGFALGATYSLMVTVIPGSEYAYEGKASAYATLRLNSPPSSGICFIDRYDGIAFVTDFTVSCVSWADDDVPLKYSFQLITVDNSTGEEVSSTPLINLSDLPYYTFPAGPGVFKVGASIVDSQGAKTSSKTEIFAVALDDEDQEIIQSDPAEYLTNLTEGKAESTITAAVAGDMALVAGYIASLSSTMDLIRKQENRTDEALAAMEFSRDQMSELLDKLLENLIPTLDTFKTLATILKTVVRDIEELGPDAVEIASGTVGKIVDAMISLLSGSYISNFPVPVVQDLSDSVTNMMVKGADLGLAEELEALYDAAQTTLLESLTDTLPGQNGFNSVDDQTKMKVQRKSPDEISEASTEYADLPEFPALDGSSSADTLMRADTFDIYTNTSSVGDIVSVNLFDSSLQATSRRLSKGFRRRKEQIRRLAELVEIHNMDECEPILLVMQTTAFADRTDLIGTGVAPNVINGTEFEFPECLSVPTSDPSAAGGRSTWNSSGCTVIWWTNTTATCSCTHLSAFGADLSSFIPDFSCFTDPGISSINLASLSRNYMVVVASFTLLFILIRMMPNLEKKASDKHLLAHQFIWAERRYLLVKESMFFMLYKSKTHKYFWTRWSLIYRVTLRNLHPVLSICLRNTGTNFTAHQRLLCVLSSLGTCLAINSIFYGFTFETPVTETSTIIFVTIIASIIPRIGKLLFVKHKMTTHTGAKQRRMDKYNERLACFKYWIGCYCFCAPCQSWVNKQWEKRNEHNKEKIDWLNARLAEHEDMRRNEEIQMTVGGVIKGVSKSIKRTFSPHNHEGAYGFRDDEGERAVFRTVKLDFNKQPFQSLEETFEFFDGDNSGHISRKEFAEAMDHLDHNHTAEDVEDMLNQMDFDGDGMINFAEFSHALAHIKFDQEGRQADYEMLTERRLSSTEVNVTANEIDARSKALTSATIENVGGIKCAGYQEKLKGEEHFNTTTIEGEQSASVESNDMGPGGRSNPVIRKNQLAAPCEDQPMFKNFISEEEERFARPKKKDVASEVRERIARTISIDANDLDYLEQRAEAVGLYRSPDQEYGFIAKDISAPDQKHVTSIWHEKPREKMKTNSNEITSVPSVSFTDLNKADVDLNQINDRELPQESDTKNSKLLGEMGEAEFHTWYNERFKLSRNKESNCDNDYNRGPSSQSKIREGLNAKRKFRGTHPHFSASNVEEPGKNIKKHLPHVGENPPSKSPSLEHSHETTPPTNTAGVNHMDSGASVVLLDWAYLSDAEQQSPEKQKSELIEKREVEELKRKRMKEELNRKEDGRKVMTKLKKQDVELKDEKTDSGNVEKKTREKHKTLKKKMNKNDLKTEQDKAHDAQKKEMLMGVMPRDTEELLMMLSDSSTEDIDETRDWYQTPDGNEELNSEVHLWKTWYGLNSMSKVVVSQCSIGADKSPFMKEESDFWISNRVSNLVQGGLDRNLRRVKNWELKLLVEFQEEILEKTFKMPKMMLKFAWCCFVIWIVGMIGIIFMWGVNMGSDAADKPEPDLVEAGTSNCPEREISTGDTLVVDVSADDSLNLEGAQNTANAVNANFTRYGSVLPEWLTLPDFDFMPEDVPESYRFLASSLTSWATGVVIVPLFRNIIRAFLLTLLYRNEAERLRELMDQKSYFRHTDIMDYRFPDQVFFVCCWPDALVKILAEDTKEEDLLKLKLDTRSIIDKILEFILRKA